MPMSNVSSAEKRPGTVSSTRPSPTFLSLTNSWTLPPFPTPPSDRNSTRTLDGWRRKHLLSRGLDSPERSREQSHDHQAHDSLHGSSLRGPGLRKLKQRWSGGSSAISVGAP